MMQSNDLSKYQVKSTTPVDEYVCTLDEDLLSYAEEALNETEEKRQNGIKELREWVFKNERIEKCRLDSKYLLRFLRVTKHNLKRAKEMLERWLIFREGLYGLDWFSNLDIDRPNLQDLMDKGFLIVLPTRSYKKERVIIVRCQAINPKTPDIGNIAFSLSTLIYETLHENEEDQIRGFRFILDVSKISLSHYFIFNFNTWNRLMKHVERTCTNRNRGCHIINLHYGLLFIAKMAMRQMKEKNRNKNQFHSNIDEIDFIDKKYLPLEYGGETPMIKFIEPMTNAIRARRADFENYRNMKLNHNLYIPEVLKIDPSTLAYTLENRKANYVFKYVED